MKKIILSIFALAACFAAGAQSVGFVGIDVDARSAAMGGTGIAMPTVTGMAIYNNTAAIGLSDSKGAVSYSYSPWQRDAYKGDNLHSIAGFYRINNKHTVALGARYYNQHNSHTEIWDTNDVVREHYSKPVDMTIDLGYAFTINETMAVGANVRYVSSDLDYPDADKASMFGFDLGYYFRKNRISAAFVLSNVGTEVDYGGADKYNMPAWARAGVAYAYPVADKHLLTGSLQLDYMFITDGDADGIEGGVGVEYMYNKLIAVRAGYRVADDTRDFNYGSAGLGVNVGPVDFSATYLFGEKDCPWNKTMMFSLGARF